MAKRRAAQPAAAGLHPAHLLPDELWALVLSKCAWEGAWQQVQPLLLWRPGAAAALFGSDDRLIELFLAQQQQSQGAALVRAVRSRRAALVHRLLDSKAAGQEDGGAAPWYSRRDREWDDGRKFSQLQIALPLAASNNQADITAALIPKCTVADAEAVFVGMSSAAVQGHTAVLARLRPWMENAQSQFTKPLDSVLFADVALLPTVIPQLGEYACTFLLPLTVLLGREVVAEAVLRHGSRAAAARPEALHMAAACRKDRLVRLLLAQSGPQGIPAAVMEQLLSEPAIANNVDMVQLLLEHAAVRTRAPLRHYDVLVKKHGQAGVSEETTVACCMRWMSSLMR